MKVDHVLILAAGKGTRMGEVGKILPKVIWPIFGKSLLELQVAYARKIAPNAKIHINLFNYKNIVYDFIQNNSNCFSDVEILIENEVLDIGGAIHNLSEQLDYNGNLLILNSDQFLYFKESMISESLEKLNDFDSLLYTYTVNSKDGYNALDIKKGCFSGIILNKELAPNEPVETYTGMALIRLNRLERCKGESKFFQSIANPKNNKIALEKINKFEYWDFGTLKRYHYNIYELLNSKETSFYKFLNEEKAFDFIDTKSQNLLFKDFKVSPNSISYRGVVDYLVD
jgi:mannose-1-phosphate guanylyltransferase